MKILDRYILKKFLLGALFGLIAFVSLFVVIDLMENLGDFLDHNVDTPIIIRYYLAFMPEIVKLMMPVAVLLSCLFTTGKLASQNELTAMKSGGLSMYRYMTPLLIVALFISLASVYFNGWIVPSANQYKSSISQKYLQRGSETAMRINIYLQDGPKRIVYINRYDGTLNLGSRVSIEEFSDTSLISLERRYDAQQIVWDSTANRWELRSGVERTFTGTTQIVNNFSELPFNALRFLPSDLVKKTDRPDEMDYFELRHFIEQQQRSGNDVSRWMVDFYSKVSFPFASVIVVLFGVPFSFGKRRSGLALQFGISLAVCFIYLAFMKISQVFGYNGDLNPLLTAWLANLLFASAGVINIIRAEK
ncbi:MAG TPA: LPS export ABC transporter permease LptG [Bacteroidota bacterium]|nr:LPS export ABC transporter permease LptG [Bacteroidota bacterium]